jgi:hypothetical protein
MVFKYIRIYNKLSKRLGIVELYFVKRIKPIKFSSEYIYGPYVYSDEDTEFRELEKLTDINEEPDYIKFIMDKEGNVFTTPTGLVAHKYFYLEYYYTKDDPEDSDWPLRVGKVVYIEFIKLFGKKIKIIFMLKKKK